jgi:hypothetical protein
MKVKGKIPTNKQKVCCFLYCQYLKNRELTTEREISSGVRIASGIVRKTLSELRKNGTIRVVKDNECMQDKLAGYTCAKYGFTERGLDYGVWVFDNADKLNMHPEEFI